MELTVTLLSEATEFIHSLDVKTMDKVFFNIRKTRMGMTGEWFQKMTGTDDIWEFLTLYNKQYIRLFAFWDKRSAADPDHLHTWIVKDNGENTEE